MGQGPTPSKERLPALRVHFKLLSAWTLHSSLRILPRWHQIEGHAAQAQAEWVIHQDYNHSAVGFDVLQCPPFINTAWQGSPVQLNTPRCHAVRCVAVNHIPPSTLSVRASMLRAIISLWSPMHARGRKLHATGNAQERPTRQRQAEYESVRSSSNHGHMLGRGCLLTQVNVWRCRITALASRACAVCGFTTAACKQRQLPSSAATVKCTELTGLT